MNIKNKTFYSIILVGTLLCIILGIFVRESITEFKFEKINDIAESYSYHPYNSVEYSNGIYVDIDNIQNTNSIYKYIIKGKSTGKRKVVEQSTLTEIQVDTVLKGDINDKIIKIYEPIGFQGNAISTFDGYNFIQDDKEYIFCLTDLKDGVKNHDENNIRIYTYSTPFYGKFPINYTDSDFKIYSKSKDEKPDKYIEFKNIEQVFSSEDRKNLYFQEYYKLINLLKN